MAVCFPPAPDPSDVRLGGNLKSRAPGFVWIVWPSLNKEKQFAAVFFPWHIWSLLKKSRQCSRRVFRPKLQTGNKKLYMFICFKYMFTSWRISFWKGIDLKCVCVCWTIPGITFSQTQTGFQWIFNGAVPLVLRQRAGKEEEIWLPICFDKAIALPILESTISWAREK